MIVCFSGTGNSRKVAKELAVSLHDSIVEINSDSLSRLAAGELLALTGGRVIWVFPVYAWGLPDVVEEFMANVGFDVEATAVDHWMVCTCGDDIGHTARLWRRVCARRGWPAKGAFSVAMPNRYVFLPGFNFDKPEVAQAKLEAMPRRVESIARVIAAGFRSADDVVEGSMPALKSGLLRSVFNRCLVSPKGFKVDSSKCNGCSTCANVCPLRNIRMADGVPHWSANCTFCTACYFFCPQKAISWRLY